jgi:3-methyladenine DNA glycosylase AlkC
MEPLKEMFNREFYQYFAGVFADADKNFNPNTFVNEVTQNLDSLTLNGRLRNTAVVLRKYLPEDFKKAVEVLYKAAPDLRRGYTALVLPDFVALYGKKNFELSMEALRDFTGLGSSEFAIREFLKTDPEKTLSVMEGWAENKDHHIRRLASEGSRPRLPWSFKLEYIINNPSVTTVILEKLMADETLYVRKSVANHLNDISKDNTPYMLQLLRSWDYTNPHTSWIIKHASRTLIKKGDQESLSLFNFEQDVKLTIENFKLDTHQLKLGEELYFSFELKSLKDTPQKLVIDYAVHYRKAAGTQSKKVFKLKEIMLLPGQLLMVSKRQLFKNLTTRKHHNGEHLIEIMVNGKAVGRHMFELIC